MKPEQISQYANLVEKIKELRKAGLDYLRMHLSEVKSLDEKAVRKVIAYPGDLSDQRILKLVQGVERMLGRPQ
jgi:pyruvate formate-lyase activating enzyme-like uncharacterized protein